MKAARAMVLAAGLGTRLWPLTELAAKPALPLLNRPLLHWTMELLARHGVEEVVVNLHHRPETVREALGDGRRFGLRVRYTRERRILGTGGGPRRARALLGEAPVLLLNGDVMLGFDLGALVRRHAASGARATLALKPLPARGGYGAVVTGRDGRVRSLAGLPAPARGTRSLFTGVHVIDPELLERLPARGASDTVRDLYAPMIAAGEPVQGVRVRGAWHDIGTPRLYLAAHLELLRAGRSAVDPLAELETGAYVRRAAIGAGARVERGARIVDSVVWGGARVGPRARLRRAIVTTGARVAAGEVLTGAIAMPEGSRPRRVAVS